MTLRWRDVFPSRRSLRWEIERLRMELRETQKQRDDLLEHCVRAGHVPTGTWTVSRSMMVPANPAIYLAAGDSITMTGGDAEQTNSAQPWLRSPQPNDERKV